MKTFYRFNFKNAVVFLILIFAFAVSPHAQTPQFYNTNSGGIGNTLPFNAVNGYMTQWLIGPGEYNQPSPAPPGNITKLYINMSSTGGPATYTNLTIRLGQTALTTFPVGGVYTGQLDTVYYRTSVALSSTINTWMSITFDRSFPYNPSQSLVIEVSHCGFTGTGMSIWQSAGTTGIIRRNNIPGTPSCVFTYSGQDTRTLQCGVDIAPGICNYSWVNQVSGSTSLRTVKAVNDMIAWAAGAAASVRKTTDGGATWTDGNPNPGVINGLIYNIDAIDANNAWCTTSPAATFIYRTTNGGANWAQVFTQAAPGFINGIQFINSNTGFAQGDPVAARWSLWKSTNAGASWDSAGMYLPQSGADAGWVNSFQVTPGGNMWFGTNNTRVYKSTNFGANFTFGATTGLLNSYSVYFNTASLGLAGGTTIVKSTDGGATYTGVGTPPGAGNINGIDGKDNDFWYIRGTGIYRSTNGGNNWAQVHTVTGTGNHIDFTEVGGCLIGWAVTSTGGVSKMRVTPVGIGNNNNEIVNSYRLEQNYPNPFNPVTSITFALPAGGNVEIKLFDILGREAATIFSGFKPEGSYTIDFDASDLTSGVYFYKMTADNFSEIKKMILLK